MDPVVTACTSCGAALLPDSRYCEACGMRVPGAADHREQATCCGAGVTDRGRRHRANQDAFAVGCAPDAAWGVVCDGVSTSPDAARAARAAAEAAAGVLAGLAPAGHDPHGAVLSATRAAARAVAALGTGALGAGRDAPACTFVCAVLSGGTAAVGWLGDSRAYWLAGPESVQLTQDDAVRGSHAITRWLGADAEDTEPHLTAFRPPTAAGAVLLCTDGLWNYTPDPAALDRAAPDAAGAPLDAARRLTDLALAAGGHDNITAVLLPMPITHRGHTS